MKTLEETLAILNSLGKSAAHAALGIQFKEADEDRLLLAMPITAQVRQPAGRLHGGISMFLAETAASVHCCCLVDLQEVLPVGIEINGSHLRGAETGSVEAEARVLSRTRSLIVHEVDIRHVESGELLSRARVTNYLKRWNQARDPR